MITSLRLQNFRSYADASFEMSPSVNIIVGPNASGKTNLLEAVLVICRGKSYRVKDGELIMFGQPWSRLDADLSSGGRRTVKNIGQPKPEKTVQIEGKSYKRLGLQHTLPTVLFEPNHLQLLAGGPERRREYLDDLLEQTTAGYGSTRRQYRRTLAQRNALLKQPRHNNHDHLFPWDIRLSELAGKIARARNQLVWEINSELASLYQTLSQAGTLVTLQYDISYKPEQYETQLVHKLAQTAELDRVRGFTGSGPHREDMTTFFNNHPAQDTASRGEVRTAILALKIIELQLIEAARGISPILLLDDVFSELDGKRRHALTDYLSRYQTFITTTDADLVLQHFTEKTNIIPLQ